MNRHARSIRGKGKTNMNTELTNQIDEVTGTVSGRKTGKKSSSKKAPATKKAPAKSAKPAKGASKKAAVPTKNAKPAKASTPRAESKGSKIIELLGKPKGASLAELMEATGWQAHSVRGFLSTAAKKQALTIESTKSESGVRTYRITK
jgi:hypothetical protein